MQIERVSVPVETRAPGGATNAYVVGRDEALLVDPAARTEELDDFVADRDVAHVAVTHAHPDHVGAVADYAEMTDATVWAHEDHVDRFLDATGVPPDRTFGEGSVLTVDGGSDDNGDSDDSDGAADDGGGAEASDDENRTGSHVRVLGTPGHAPDHVCFAVGDDVVSGDLAVQSGSVVVGAPEGNMSAYITSLLRLRAKEPARLFPGHGPSIEETVATLDRLVEHRLRREERVLAAIRDGAADVDTVLDAAYDKDLTGVRDLARATVVAHIEKLAAEDRIEWNRDAEAVTPA